MFGCLDLVIFVVLCCADFTRFSSISHSKYRNSKTQRCLVVWTWWYLLFCAARILWGSVASVIRNIETRKLENSARFCCLDLVILCSNVLLWCCADFTRFRVFKIDWQTIDVTQIVGKSPSPSSGPQLTNDRPIIDVTQVGWRHAIRSVLNQVPTDKPTQISFVGWFSMTLRESFSLALLARPFFLLCFFHLLLLHSTRTTIKAISTKKANKNTHIICGEEAITHYLL
jgi:hypothetical protein